MPRGGCWKQSPEKGIFLVSRIYCPNPRPPHLLPHLPPIQSPPQSLLAVEVHAAGRYCLLLRSLSVKVRISCSFDRVLLLLSPFGFPPVACSQANKRLASQYGTMIRLCFGPNF
ncbi:hypothetical protein U9M48_001274 [Paspalum notatum var. saurae]|uniref:Uncharacterized protein n=1 Tax=Paspalum notatum var. saurae TaxID=547442 RepID=A0AAQ3PLP5_PASNO